MKTAFASTPCRTIPKPTALETESSDASLCTPRPATSRGLGQSRTCIKARPAQLQSSTTLKKRAPSIMGDRVKVFVRVKPVMEDDLKSDRNQVAVAVLEKDNQRGVSIPAGNGKENWFADFDGVLDDATNQELFDVVGGDLINQYLSGVNVSIMAYGQTGSGKTYSMFGCDDSTMKVQGMLHMILRRVDESVCIGTHHSRLSISVFEVYNEEVFSLLDVKGVERRLLRVKEGEYLQHRPKCVGSVDEAIGLVLDALRMRTQDATVRNATSSRSHAFVKLHLEQADRGIASQCFVVDLAGSESYNNAQGSTQQRETISINSSLGALERVVNSLSMRCGHVPYRDSLLTQVLQEGLDPQKARVALLTTISPFQHDLVVTKSTLNFAQRARNIRTYAQVNAAPRRQAPAGEEELHRQLQSLQAINNTLRQQLADMDNSHERLASERHLRAMEDELQRMAELHAALQRASARHQQEAEAVLELARAEHAMTRSQLTELQGNQGELERKLAAAEEEAQKEAALVAALRAQLAEAQREAAALKGQLAYANALTAEVDAQHKEAQEQLVLAREQLTQLRGQLAVAEANEARHKHNMEQQLSLVRTEARVERDAAMKEAALLRQLLQDIQQDIDEARLEATQKGRGLTDALQQVARLELRISEADHAVLALQQQLESAEQRAEQHAMRVHQLLGSMQADAGKDQDDNAQEQSQDAPEMQEGSGEAASAQLQEVLEQVAVMEEELAAARDQAEAAQAERRAAMQQVQDIRGSAQAEVEVLRAQLAEQVETLRRQSSAHSAALAAAVQEARAASEAAAVQRLVPLQTECERLRATVAMSEQQLARLQAECEHLRGEDGAAAEEVVRLQTECERLREAAARADAEAAERVAKLEAQRDAAAVRPDVVKQLQDRVRQLELEKKRAEGDHKGCLELKDKLIHQLELMNHQLQSEVAKLRQDAQPPTSDLQGGAVSPLAGPQHSDRAEAVSPCPTGDSTPGSSANVAGPGRAPSTGILLLGRTTTSSAAALARNTKALRSELSTPPPPPRMTTPFAQAASVPLPVNLVSPGADAGPPAAPEVINLITPDSTPAPQQPLATPGPPEPALTPGPPEPRLTPEGVPLTDDGLVMVVRTQRLQALKHELLDSSTTTYRNRFNA